MFLLDSTTCTAYGNKRQGIQWSFTKQLEDLDFTDDRCLLAHHLQDLRSKTEALNETAKRVGLKVHPGKTKVMRVNSKQA